MSFGQEQRFLEGFTFPKRLNSGSGVKTIRPITPCLYKPARRNPAARLGRAMPVIEPNPHSLVS